MPIDKSIILKIVLTEIGFIPSQGTKIDKKELHLARKLNIYINKRLGS